MNTINSIAEIESMMQRPLPNSYKRYLDKMAHPDASSYLQTRDHGEVAMYRIKSSSPYGSLFGVQKIDRWETQTWNILSAYGSMMTRDGYTKVDIEGSDPRSISWLMKRMAIGDSNGNTVFFDHEDDWSIWIFHEDGFDVEAVAKSFDELLLLQGTT